jgi:hypothetical protein
MDLQLLLTHSRVVREAAEGRTAPLTLDDVFPTAEQKALYADALQHLLKRFDGGRCWPETSLFDSFLVVDVRRAAWLAGDVAGAARTAHYLDMDDAFMHALGADLLRAANTFDGFEDRVRACGVMGPLVEAAFARMCAAFRAKWADHGITSTLDLPLRWGRHADLPWHFAVAAGRSACDDEYRMRDHETVLVAFGRLTALQRSMGSEAWYDWCGLSSFPIRLAAHAARSGHVHVLQWLQARFGVCACRDPRVLAGAARHAHTSVLTFLLTQKCLGNASACEAAATGGHVAVLQWLREQGCPWDASACTAAARGGHMEAVQWLREHRCPWDEGTCTAAAKGGYLEIVRWLREHGCPWDEGTCTAAEEGGHVDIVRFLRQPLALDSGRSV